MAMPKALAKYWATHSRGKKSKKSGGSKLMAKNHRSRNKFTLPLAVIAGLASPVGRSVWHATHFGITGSEGGIAEFSRTMIGFNPYATPMTWEPWRMKYGLLPVLAGIAVHKLANMVGVNRMLARSGIPFIRI